MGSRTTRFADDPAGSSLILPRLPMLPQRRIKLHPDVVVIGMVQVAVVADLVGKGLGGGLAFWKLVISPVGFGAVRAGAVLHGDGQSRRRARKEPLRNDIPRFAF